MSKKALYDSLVKHIVENQNQFYRAAFYYVKKDLYHSIHAMIKVLLQFKFSDSNRMLPSS